MACYTQKEIAEREGLTHQAVDLILGEMADLPKLLKSDRAAAEHATEFTVPIYNIWKQQHKTEGNDYPGNSEVRVTLISFFLTRK